MNEFCAIFHNRRLFELMDDGTFWLSQQPAKTGSVLEGTRLPRIASWALLRVRHCTGRFILFVNTHLDLHPLARRPELEIIERFVAEFTDKLANTGRCSDNCTVYAFVSGDFNEAEAVTSALWQEFDVKSSNDTENDNGSSHRLIDCVHALLVETNHALNVPLTYHAFEGLSHMKHDVKYGAPVDWILCSVNVLSDFTLRDAFVVPWNSTFLNPSNASATTVFPSDHFPIVLDISMSL